MPSIIEGYNYDIFISYRQKDNKGDHWVSEFVEALTDDPSKQIPNNKNQYYD